MDRIVFVYIIIFCNSFIGTAQQNTLADEKREIPSNFKDPLFVSLGPECYFAWFLDELGYRKAAFPFDWVLTTDQDRLIALLDDNFKYFFDRTYHEIHTNGYPVHNYYHLEFRHEHDNNFDKKYQRRIDRFCALNNYEGKVFFMRKAYDTVGAEPPFYWSTKETSYICTEGALRLNAALKMRFPDLDYNLVVLNYSESQNYFQILDRVIFFDLVKGEDLKQLSMIVNILINYADDPHFYREGMRISLENEIR